MHNIGVFCFLEYENKFFLVKKNYDNYAWTLPGGAVQNGEGIIDALKREVFEETGQTMADCNLFRIFYSKDHYSMAICYYSCLQKLDKITFDKHELSQVDLFDLAHLPELISPRHKIWVDLFLENEIHGTSTKDILSEFM